MKAHAVAIAEKLQGAHEARRRGEDEDMGKGEVGKAMEAGVSVWDDDPIVHAMKLAERLEKVLGDLAASGHAPGEPQSNAVTPERVVELERQLADAKYNAESFRGQAESAGRAHADALARIEELEEQRDASDAAANERDGESEELQQAQALLATAYVVREVPWSDVAAGMMTIARDGAPWMVVGVGDGAWTLTGLHAQQIIRFDKTPQPGETVRVLVPYVTPEAAETAVREQLGGTAVS